MSDAAEGVALFCNEVSKIAAPVHYRTFGRDICDRIKHMAILFFGSAAFGGLITICAMHGGASFSSAKIALEAGAGAGAGGCLVGVTVGSVRSCFAGVQDLNAALHSATTTAQQRAEAYRERQWEVQQNQYRPLGVAAINAYYTN